MMKFIRKALLIAATSLIGIVPALAQTETFSAYVTGLAPVSSVIGSERMFALQTGIPSTVTPYQILNKVIGDCTIASPPSIICTKTNGATFAASATTDTTNASNISSGTLSLNRLALPSAFDYVGNVSNIPVGVAMSGDCTRANNGAITCTKTSGVTFAPSATSDTTNATNISSGTLAGARYAAANLAAGGNGGVTGVLPHTNLPTGSLDTVLGFWGSTTRSAIAVPNCTAGSLQYNTTTHVWSCSANAGTGNVSNSGTPTVNQIGQWVTATTIKGSNVSAFSLIAVVKTQTFTASGTYTPSTGIQHAIIECLGGGAGGGAVPNSGASVATAAGGGAAGSYSKHVATAAAIGGSKVVAIGNAGAGGPAGNNAGADGGATSVGALCTAPGGLGGGPSAGGPGAAGLAGLAGTGNMVAIPGNNGGTGAFNTNSSLMSSISGYGGNAFYGNGGIGVSVGTGTGVSNGIAAGGFGAGGSGAITMNNAGAAAGGNGTPGYVVITEFTNQ